MSGDYGREKKHKRNESREIQNQEEITELHSIVMELMDKIEELHRNRSQTRIPFASPDTSAKLKKVLQNYHRHQRDTYILLLNPQKQKANRQRTGINSRRKDKKERCQRGLKRIINTKDQMLTDLEFSNLIKDLRKIINDSNYHSDEVSEIDEEEVADSLAMC
ncbi:hypothetical protein GLOIN_2v1476716 [Rhizophagus irregularis DAOM 181602=DAOM 197198]|uniref:Uncharacterized protein n=1 Tax=Rhizophagus irregularis (strain DAOM 181602 / DAOM 197198 / MUCL 43194) TaxID=747089 RepID=A0A2P4Q815_RHIID|nr:hypothetical protein GLOIN_2v1476716 [Rhizophagus irregularis DAOM 181602=DAOM 197198]POG73780.1 hypothetical protein GLOIN_2v1476716 [Rhizophagus irregularis DAOM 181602=DAOM 197198]|eukprot:XP_025180646.1 hypothetical protein GLOIN_2v1476716 [Rhizophagus irregularis DAOM 181602=DAOM 197198]